MNYLNIICKITFGTNHLKSEILKNVLPNSCSLFLIARSQKKIEEEIRVCFPNALFIVHSGEPTVLAVNKILEIPQMSVVENIVAIGGGSVLDLGKCLALAVDLKLKDITGLLDNIFEQKRSRVKLILAPTTSGTGSEVSLGAIITKENGGKSGVRGLGVAADLAIVDVSLAETMPRHIAQDTAFDVLTHAVESYFSKKSNTLVRLNSEHIIRFIFDNKIKIFKTERTKEISTKLSYYSCLAGINLASSSTCLPHRIQYVVSRYCKLSHARALMLIYPVWIKAVSNILVDVKSLEEELEVESLISEFDEIFKLINHQENLSRILIGVTVEDLVSLTSGNLSDDPIYTPIVLEEIFNELKRDR